MIPALSNLNECVISTPSHPNQQKQAEERKRKRSDDPGIDSGKVLKRRFETTPTKSRKGGIKDEDAESENGIDS